jgi:hypothetical protein
MDGPLSRIGVKPEEFYVIARIPNDKMKQKKLKKRFRSIAQILKIRNGSNDSSGASSVKSCIRDLNDLDL